MRNNHVSEVNISPRIHAGKVDIGPEYALPLYGYGERQVSASVIRESLEANWVHVEDLTAKPWLLLAIDTLFSSATFETALRRHLIARGVEVAELIVVASHTHFAPALDDTKPALGVADLAYIEDVAGLVAADVSQGVQFSQDLAPEYWTYANKNISGAVFRRAKRLTLSMRSRPNIRISTQIAPNPSIKIDQDLRVWIARNLENVPLFALVTWPCHATSRSNPGRISPDFVGVLRDGIRAEFRLSIPVLYFPGASGDVRPNFSGLGKGKRLFYPYPFQIGFERPDETTVTAFDATLSQAAQHCANQAKTRLPFDGCIVVKTEIPHTEFMQGADESQMRIAMARLGGIDIFGFGAEISALWPNLLGLDNERERCLVTGCVGHCFGYLPEDSQIPNGGYEVLGFRESFRVTGNYSLNQSIYSALKSSIDYLLDSRGVVLQPSQGLVS